MANYLLLDKEPVRLLLPGGGLQTAYPVRRRDWPLLPVGAAVAWLDTGEEMSYGPRILWVGRLLSNQFKARGRGGFCFAPAEPDPHDDPTFDVTADSLKRLYLLALPATVDKATNRKRNTTTGKARADRG